MKKPTLQHRAELYALRRFKRRGRFVAPRVTDAVRHGYFLALADVRRAWRGLNPEDAGQSLHHFLEVPGNKR